MGESHDLRGRTLGEFVLRERVGEGGFGAVYRAEQPILQREAVVKVALGTGTIAAGEVEAFLAEARLASRIDHPFAAHVYAFGAEPDGTRWIAMELVRGTPLNTVLRESGAMPLARALPLLGRLCEVVHAVHDAGVVHRDLKPSNIMVVSRAGTMFPKLLDLGIARDVRDVGEAPAPTSGERFAGTPLYMAPEQWVAAHTAGPTADVYALGAIAYEVLTGAPPFDGKTVRELAAKHARQAPPALPPSFPAGLSTAITRAMAKRPADRYASALEFAAALRDSSGLDLDVGGTATLDEVVREDLLLHAPQPIAEAIAALDAARLPGAVRDALWHAAKITAQFAGVLALAARVRSGPGRLGETPAATQLLTSLRTSTAGLDAESWWKLARELVRPYAGIADAHPLPELVGLFFDGKAELRTSMDVLLSVRRQQPGPSASADDIRTFLGGAVPALSHALTSLRAIYAYTLAVPRAVDEGQSRRFAEGSVKSAEAMTADPTPSALPTLAAVPTFDATGLDVSLLSRNVATTLVGGAVPLRTEAVVTPIAAAYATAWTGVRRAHRRQIRVTQDLPPTRPVLLGGDGSIVLSLHPLVQLGSPMPGAPDEMFWLDGKAKLGAQLVALPGAHIRTDDALWSSLGLDLEPQVATGVAAALDQAPYRGLSTFTQADAGLFFGREREVEGFVNRLRAASWVAVVGPSGAGKSSFVQAGVLPALGDDWQSVIIRPGSAPLASVCARLATLDIHLRPDELLAAPERLGTALREHASRPRADGPDRKLLLIIDQFEELFTMCHDAVAQQAFAEAVTRAAGQHEAAPTEASPVRVVITMRDDFLVRAAQLPALRDAISANLQILTTPVEADLLRILTEPARRAGFRFEDDALPKEMVAEVHGQSAALALLSFTASQLWQFRDRELHLLPRKAYRALGGVGGALAQHAEATLESLSPDEQPTVRELFRHLVTADGTRATLSRAELLQVAGGASAEAPLERLIHARLLTAMDNAAGGESIEVVHEALLAAWPRLVSWRADDAETVRVRDSLRAAAKIWDDKARTRALLWRGDLLTEYQLWRPRYRGHLTTLEEAFASASLADARRSRRLKRGLAATAFILLAIGIVLLLVSNRRTARARAAAVAAATQAAEARTRAEKNFADLLREQGRTAALRGDYFEASTFLRRFADTEFAQPVYDRLLAYLERWKQQVIWHRGERTTELGAAYLDGDTLWMGYADGVVDLLDAQTGRIKQSWRAPSAVTHIAGSSTRVVVSYRSGATAFRAQTTATLASLTLPAETLVFSEVFDDATFASATTNRHFYFWNSTGQQQDSVFPLYAIQLWRTKDAVLAALADDRVFTCSPRGGSCRDTSEKFGVFLETSAGAIVALNREVSFPNGKRVSLPATVVSMSLVHDGMALVAGTIDGTLAIINTERADVLSLSRPIGTTLSTVATLADNHVAVSTGDGKTALLGDLGIEALRLDDELPATHLWGYQDTLVVVRADGGVTAVRIAPELPALRRVASPVNSLFGMAESYVGGDGRAHIGDRVHVPFNDSRLLRGCRLNGGYAFADLASSNVVVISDAGDARTLLGHEKGIAAIACSADGRFIVSGSLDQTVIAWNVETGMVEDQWTLSGRVSAMALHDHTVVAGTVDGRATIMEVGHSQPLISMQVGKSALRGAVLTRSWALLGSEAGEVARIDLPNGQLHTAESFGSHVSNMAASPEGSLVAVGGAGDAVVVYEALTGKRLLRLSVPGATGITSMLWTHDLWVGTLDGHIAQFKLRTLHN